MWENDPWRWWKALQLNLLFAVLQGTSAEQDNRFSNKQKKLLKQLKFAECLEKKVSGMGEWEIHQSLFSGFTGYQVEQRNVFPKTLLEDVWDVPLNIRCSNDISCLLGVLNITSRLFCNIQLLKKSASQQILINLEF